MSDAANRVVQSLNEDIKDEQEFEDNQTPGTVPAKFYDQIVYNKDEKTGRFAKSIERKETQVKDNVVQKNELIQIAQEEVIAYTELAKTVDLPIAINLSAINQKKLEIASIISTNCGVCSCVAGAASSNGVIIGVGTPAASYILPDYVGISIYNNLNNPGSDTPFSDDTEVPLTISNAGAGYRTELLEQNYMTDDEIEAYEDYGIAPYGYGPFRRFTGLDGNGITDNNNCSQYNAQIDALIAEIGGHREEIINRSNLTDKVNQIKDKKTEKELMLWSLQHDQNKMGRQAQADRSLRDLIKGEPLFGYRSSVGSPATIEFIEGLSSGSFVVGSYVPSEGGYYLGVFQYAFNPWEQGAGTNPQYHIFLAPKDSGETTGKYKTANSCDGAESTQTSAQSTYDGYWNTYQSTIGSDNSLHPIFQFAQNANINGKTDWYIPARVEITMFGNVARNQTLNDHSVNPFNIGGPEEIELLPTQYWTSTGGSCENSSGQGVAAVGQRATETGTFATVATINKSDIKKVRLIRRVLASGGGNVANASELQYYWYATLDGSGGDDIAMDVVVDNNGNVYITGFTAEVGGNSVDAFIVKYDAQGAIQWQRILIGNSLDSGNGIALDSENNVYIGGRTTNQTTGTIDALIAKYNTNGALIWQRSLGNASPSSTEIAHDIAVDSSDNVYICGQTTVSNYEGFLIAKYNSSGTIQWQRQLYRAFGTESSIAHSIALDSSDNVYVFGNTTTYSNGLTDLLLNKYNSSGTLQWSTRFHGGTLAEEGFGVDVDNSGNAYVTGYSNSLGSDTVLVVAKFNTSGSIQWQRSISSSGNAVLGYAIAVDNYGNVYVGGHVNTTSSGYDFLIVKYSVTGNIQWQRTFGSSVFERLEGITCDSAGNVHVTGTYGGGNVPKTVTVKIPADGSLTGTHGDFVFEESQLTDSATSFTFFAPGPALLDEATTMTSNVSLLSNQVASHFTANTVVID